MAYSVKVDLVMAKDETILKQIAGENGVINDDWITEGIEAADASIDVKCEKYYITPFDPVPKIIKKWSVQLALNWLYRRSNMSNRSAEEEVDKINADLILVSENELNIPGATKKLTGRAVVSDVYEDNIFTMGDLEVK